MSSLFSHGDLADGWESHDTSGEGIHRNTRRTAWAQAPGISRSAIMQPDNSPYDVNHHDVEGDQEGPDITASAPLTEQTTESSAFDTVSLHSSEEYNINQQLALGDVSIQIDEEPTEIFEPIKKPLNYPPLTYLPTMLTPETTLSLAGVYAIAAIGTGLLYLMSSSDQAYVVRDVYIFLVARFGPALVAAMTTSLFNNTVQELTRMLPYINMADHNEKKTKAPGRWSIGATYWPVMCDTNTQLTMLLSWLRPITGSLIGLKTLLLQIVEQDDRWIVIVHGEIALTIVIFYALALIFNLTITWMLWSRETGLRKGWDHSSLADMLTLFYWRNFKLEDVTRPDGFIYPSFRASVDKTVFRLGYWKKTKNGRSDIVYGVRAVGVNIDKSPPEGRGDDKTYRVTRQSTAGYPYLKSPLTFPFFYVRIVMTIGMIFLLIAIWATGYVSNGFLIDSNSRFHRLDRMNLTLPLDGPNTTVSGDPGWFTISDPGQAGRLLLWDFILRTSPLWVTAFMFAETYFLDAQHRFTQPFFNMSKAPASAVDSILLEYLTMSPLEVTQEAFKRSHWKVFYFSILNAASNLLALIPWGALRLTAVGTGPRTIIIGQFSLPFYIATFLLFLTFFVSCVVAWPRDRRRLPRKHTSLLDLWVLCYASHLAGYEEFGRCTPTWTRNHLIASLQLKDDRYVLGVLRGDDGTQRLGIDVISTGRMGDETGYVERVQARSRARAWVFQVDLFKRLALKWKVKRQSAVQIYELEDNSGIRRRAPLVEHDGSVI